MKKVLFVPALILCLFVSCKKNEVAEKPVDESPAQIVEPVQASAELTQEEKDVQKVDQILNDPNLTVYQKIESLGYQVMDMLKFNYRKESDDLVSWREREIKYDESYEKLTKEKLMSTIWVLDKEVAEPYVLLFYSDDYFAIGSLDSGPSAIGKYRIEKDKMYLSSFSYDPDISFYGRIFGVDDVKCYMNYRSASFYYDSELVLRDIKFFPTGSEKEAGTGARVDGAGITIIKEQKVISENIKFHTKPSADSQTQNIEMYKEMFPGKTENETGILKRGTVVSVCGIAYVRETIDGVRGSWYYISIPKDGDVQYGWIFGAYFVDYDVTRKVEYQEILKAEFNSSDKTGSNPFANEKKIDLSDSSKYEVHDLTLFLNYIEESGWNIKVYDSPDLEKEIYMIKKGDDVKFTRYVTVKASGKTSVEMETTSGVYGFVEIKNPYANGQFEYLETISVDGKDVEVLRLEDSFDVTDGINIKSLPSEKSENLHEITHEEGGRYHKTSAITADYKWVKITIDEWTGWVPANSLSVNRGGPIIDTPINMIEWELEGCNLI